MKRLFFRDYGAFARAARSRDDLCAIPDVVDGILFTRFGEIVVLPAPEARVLVMLMAADAPLSGDDITAGESEAALAAVGRHANPSEIADRRIGAIRRKACAPLGLLVLGAYRKGWTLWSACAATREIAAA